MNIDMFADFEQFSVISGPAFASEIMDGKPATFTASSPYVMGLFKNDQITIELFDDPLGIILCGTLKNVYAIGAGYHSDSMNDMATFIERAHNEIATYLHKHGADPHTSDMACGLGDLILSSTNRESRNFTFGKRLKAGDNINDILNDLKTVEGYSAAQIIDTENYPLLQQVKDIISHYSQE
jgi:glycerol-3-phosphate dehydrogenase (NAD(P)+)